MIRVLLILLALVSISCKNKPTEYRHSKTQIELTDEEVKLNKQMVTSEKRSNHYKTTILNLLKLSNLNEIQLAEGDFAYQFQIHRKHDQYVQIIEIIDLKSQNRSSVKSIKYKVDGECNPIVGSKELTKDCIEFISEHSNKIQRMEMDSLNEFIFEQEFWELNKEEAKIRRYFDLLYHGDSWSMSGAYATQHKLDDKRDTTIMHNHIVNRMIPEDSKIITSVGNRMLDLTTK